MTSLADTVSSGLWKLAWLAIAAMVAGGLTLAAAVPASASGPTCEGLLLDPDQGIYAEWVNHGDHVVGDYLIGNDVGEGTGDWPPSGGEVGDAVRGGGPELPGASGIHKHGGGTVPPGASFCLEQANSPTGNELPSQ